MEQHPKKHLIVLSDIFGVPHAAWMQAYIKQLEPYFEIRVYDSKALANIDQDIVCEETIHQLFLQGGIPTAVTKLLQAEPNTVSVLGFSIGGTIAWKAALQGLKIDHFYGVSSTRIRYEIEKPNCQTVNCFYGNDDSNKPNTSWHNTMKVSSCIIYPNESHAFYTKQVYIEAICSFILGL